MLSSTKYSKSHLVWLCSLVYFVSYFSRKDFAAVMAGMISEGVIDKSAGGFIGTALFVCYGVGQLVSGYLGDKLKPSSLMLFGLSATALSNFLMPITANGAAMIFIWAVNGFAQAMLWPPIVRILADNLAHEDFVRANLIVTSAAHAATIILYLYVPVCLSLFDWKTVFFTATALAVLAITVFILALIFVLPKDAIKKPTPRVKSDSQDASESYFRLVCRAGILPIFLAIIMMGILRDGIETWLPTLYSEAFNREAGESILISVALPVFSIISIMAITALHKTKLFKNEALGSLILFACAALIAVPIVFLITKTGTALRIVTLILAAAVCAFMHGANFLLISCLPGRFSEFGRAATTSGFCNAFTYVGAAVSSYGFALISERGGWRGTVISWIIVGALGVLFTLASLKYYTSFIKENENENSH